MPTSCELQTVRGSAKSSTSVSFFDHHLKRLLRIDTAEIDCASVDSERPISRIALRKVLRDGVEHLISFGRTFERYEESPDGETIAYFEDGSTEHGTLLVGADGASSRVARQFPELTGLIQGWSRSPAASHSTRYSETKYQMRCYAARRSTADLR
jgi:2-polyprenyl-6-methoxyphenol hydroxylase-like FAD-dependent oxidoreductase